MAKKSVIARQAKREKLVKKHANQYHELKKIINDKTVSMAVKEKAQKKMRALPRKAHPVQLRNRCVMTGRPRGVFSRFGICRHMIRKLASHGLVTGLLKSSW